MLVIANIFAQLPGFVKHFSGFFTVCIAVANRGKNLPNQRDDVRIAATGRGAVWLAHLHGVQGVAGSNPVAPIKFLTAEHAKTAEKNT
jgi:hypothetical protein